MKTSKALDSREVAEMVRKRHGDMLRDIETYIRYMEEPNERKIASVNFFSPSTYVDSKGETRKHYLVTKRGCEMIANKLTGAKGVQFTALYVDRFNSMEDGYKALGDGSSDKLLRAQAMYLNAQTRQFNAIMKAIGDKTKLAPIAVEVFGLRSMEKVLGINVENLLPETRKTYSATEIGNMCGRSAQAVGKAANTLGLKTDEYGIWVIDKSPYSAKEVESFRYYENAAERLCNALGS